MKRIFTLLAVTLFIGVGASAQNNTMVLIEESTNASCNPCASQNPAFDALLDANEDKVIVLKYQWYFPGFDPMHNDNPDEANARTSYYGINGVPTAAISGELGDNDYCDGCGDWNITAASGYEGGPYGHNQDVLDYAHSIQSPLTMEVSAELVDGVMQVTGNITALEELSGNLKLRIAIAEEQINFSSAPGTNGESQFNHVMKAFIGGTSGITLSDFAMGDVYEINESMPIGGINVYDYDQLEVVAFVQNDSGKRVYQAAKDNTVEIVSSYANNAAASDIEGLPAQVCVGTQTLSPVAKIVNNGTEMLTSADLVYSINGGPEQTTAWSGSLGLLESTEVTLDPYTFEATGTNTITVTIENPNGLEDEDASDNMSSADFLAPTSGDVWNIEIVTDQYGYETYWEVRAVDGGEVVASGGNTNVGANGGGAQTATAGGPGAYGNNETNVEEVTLPASGCYEFLIVDDWGDGICCTYGDGSYTVTDGDGEVLFSGAEFTEDETAITSAVVTGLTEAELNAAISVGPNPVNDILNVRIEMDTQEPVILEVMNSIGQTVYTESLGTINGASLTQLDVRAYNAGLYYVKVIAGNAASTTKVTVIK